MFHFVTALAFALLFISPGKAQAHLSKNLVQEVRPFLDDAKRLAGDRDDMTNRALVLLHLYEKSQGNLPFALTISHLTLAIENSTYSPRLLRQLELVRMDELAQEWKEWGEELRSINRRMVELFTFSFLWTQYRAERGQDLPEENDLKELLNFLEVQDESLLPLLKVMMEVHQANQADVTLSKLERRNHFEKLVEWEHLHVIQPRMLAKAKDLSLLWRISLSNVPGRYAEALLMKPIFNIKTTLSLKCFPEKKHLRTKNFLSSKDRIDQAREFFLIFEKMSFDPQMQCFQDQNYKEQLGRDFRMDPLEYARLHYQQKLRNLSSDANWLLTQWDMIPVIERPSLPHITVPITFQDKKALAFSRDPIERNLDINQAYKEIAYKLAQCTGTEKQANWYHFAYWASRSAGEVISGLKFNSYRNLSRTMYNLASRIGAVPSEADMAAMFARTNSLIAVEMVPIGRHFLKEFCGPDSQGASFSTFSRHFTRTGLREKEMERAFANYYAAINEKDPIKKKQQVSLASTLQVMSEQRRVNENIDSVFRFGSRLRDPVERIYRWYASKTGSLKILRGEKIPLTRHVTTQYLAEELKEIVLSEYLKLHRQHQVEIIPKMSYFKKTGVKDWGDIKQRLRYLLAMFRGHSSRSEVTTLE